MVSLGKHTTMFPRSSLPSSTRGAIRRARLLVKPRQKVHLNILPTTTTSTSLERLDHHSLTITHWPGFNESALLNLEERPAGYLRTPTIIDHCTFRRPLYLLTLLLIVVRRTRNLYDQQILTTFTRLPFSTRGPVGDPRRTLIHIVDLGLVFFRLRGHM